MCAQPIFSMFVHFQFAQPSHGTAPIFKAADVIVILSMAYVRITQRRPGIFSAVGRGAFPFSSLNKDSSLTAEGRRVKRIT